MREYWREMVRKRGRKMRRRGEEAEGYSKEEIQSSRLKEMEGEEEGAGV